jgi:hypothetical protein
MGGGHAEDFSPHHLRIFICAPYFLPKELTTLECRGEAPLIIFGVRIFHCNYSLTTNGTIAAQIMGFALTM